MSLPRSPVPAVSTLLPLDELRLTATMARLHLDEPEIVATAGELARFLDFAARLREVDVSAVPPTTHALALACPLREDAVGLELDGEALLAAAPASEGRYFIVPVILPVAVATAGEATVEAGKMSSPLPELGQLPVELPAPSVHQLAATSMPRTLVGLMSRFSNLRR
jgi:aspartyl-tRNA(Asn)/glutamyl-tRNA(Gln) amidotransferase subunit C